MEGRRMKEIKRVEGELEKQIHTQREGKKGRRKQGEFPHVSPATSNSNVVSTRRGHHPVVEVQQGSKIIPTPTSHTL